MAGSGAAWAAGLGRLTVQSALGQPLRAEVEVTALTRDESATLNARLAPADAFRQAGVEFNPALAGLRFAIDRRDGRAVVRISSTQPINEPFVDLLVELNWANGRFVREYTFLLDPPELRSASREVVEGGNVQPVVPPVVSTRPSTPAPAAAAPSTPSAPAERAPRTARPDQPAGDGIEVRRGDTLAGIASRVRPDGIALDQALVALYQANPRAFYGSIHQLRSGATLAVPDRQAMAAIDPAAAREQVRVQTQDFAAYRARLADGARATPAARAGQSASGSITAQVEDKGGAAAGDQLRLSKSEPGAGAAGGGTGTAASKAAEQSVAREAAMREAQSRVTDLEKNVSDLQKLVELKNRQLAELQKLVEESKTAGKAAGGAIAKPEAAPVARPAEPPKVEAAKPEPAKVEAPKAEPPKAEPAKAEAPAAPVEAPKAEAPKPAAPKPAPVAQKKPEPSFVDDLLDNPMLLPGVGAILAIGAGYGWYAMRRRRKVEKFEDSLVAADGFAQNSLFGTTGGQSVDTNAGVFASTSSGKDSGVDVHSTEVDPIAEAEVYIAYGREAQAEEILREALKRQPERQAIRLKLLEILSGRRDAQAFNALAAEMYEISGGQNEEWPKVVTLGLGLDPTNPLYTGTPPASPIEPSPMATPADAAPAVPDLRAAFAAARIEVPAIEPAPVAPPAEPEVPAIDFGVLETPATTTAPQVPAAETVSRKAETEPEVPSLDFDLDLDTTIGKAGGMLAAGRADEPAPSDLEKAVDGRFDLPSLDLDLPEAGKSVAKEPAVAGFDDLNIDLPALESISRIGAARPAAAPVQAAEPALDLSSIGLDLEPPPAPGPGLDSAKWQEMATKLDLASAYEEIGDKEGARELLDEVLKGGDGDQQQRARSMLEKIA